MRGRLGEAGVRGQPSLRSASQFEGSSALDEWPSAQRRSLSIWAKSSVRPASSANRLSRRRWKAKGRLANPSRKSRGEGTTVPPAEAGSRQEKLDGADAALKRRSAGKCALDSGSAWAGRLDSSSSRACASGLSRMANSRSTKAFPVFLFGARDFGGVAQQARMLGLNSRSSSGSRSWRTRLRVKRRSRLVSSSRHSWPRDSR